MSKQDGGPAFPGYRQVTIQKEPQEGMDMIYVPINGMTLRDWFAGQALKHVHTYATVAEVAEQASKIADAMLKEREK